MNRRVDYPASKKPAKKTVANKNVRNKASKTLANTAPKQEHPTGANHSEQSSSVLLHAWFAHHQFSCIDSLQRLLKTPWQSLMTWMVVAIAVVLPAILYLGLHNVQQLGQDWQGNGKMSLYIQSQAQPLAIEKLQQRLMSYAEIESITVVSPDAAKQEFQQYSGLGDVLQSLDENPLPTVFIVKPAITASHPEALIALQEKLKVEPLIELAQLDTGWLRRVHEMMNIAQRAVLALAALLALGVLFIIGNTIRLAIESRRNEIVVVKMVGGTDGFVRRPFLYTGFWYGIGGGILALGLLLFAGLWLSAPVQRLAFLYDSEYSLTWFDFNTVVFILCGAALLGWLGSWLAVSRHLKSVEPE
ncbi:MAG: cell division transport system permease protein [Candidatus Endobugula sp.]